MKKVAVGPATAAAAGAATAGIGAAIFKKLFSYFEGGVKVGVPKFTNLALLTALVGGLGAGYGAAKIMSPSTLAGTTDQELTREALDTEIDVTQRQLAALELKKKRKKKSEELPAKYDRFV